MNKQEETIVTATLKPIVKKAVVKAPVTPIPKIAITADQAIAIVFNTNFKNGAELSAVNLGIKINKGVKCYMIKVDTSMSGLPEGTKGIKDTFAVDIYTGKVWDWES